MAPRAAGGEGVGYSTPASDGGCAGAASPADCSGKTELYNVLWHACAGSNVSVPRLGENVFYLPQGHMEQIEAYADQDGKMEMPIYNLPSKILCNVVCVQLKVEVHTDEVFAQITLLPVTEQDQLSLEEQKTPSLPKITGARSFSKALTPSDTSTHGRFSVPKRHADECLPPLDMSQQPPVQELVAKDLQGFEWHFRHIFRGQPKRHLLTSGWRQFVTAKRLVAGDASIFVRGENGELGVGVRRARKTQDNASAPLIFGHSMQHDILANAFHAISTGAMFTVHYRPWTSRRFIIPTKVDSSAAHKAPPPNLLRQAMKLIGSRKFNAICAGVSAITTGVGVWQLLLSDDGEKNKGMMLEAKKERERLQMTMQRVENLLLEEKMRTTTLLHAESMRRSALSLWINKG